MKYTIHEITSVNELKKYADFPNRLYKDSPYYVPGLFSDDFNTFNWEKNPAYEYCDARFWLSLIHIFSPCAIFQFLHGSPTAALPALAIL